MRLLLLGGTSDLLCERWFVGIDRVAQEQRLAGRSGLRFAGLAETVSEICSATSGNVASTLRNTLQSHRLDVSLTDPESILVNIRLVSSGGISDFEEPEYIALVDRVIARFHRCEPAADFFLAATDSHWLLDNQRSNLVVDEREFRDSFLKLAPSCRPSLPSTPSVAGPCGSAIKRFVSSTLPPTIAQLEQQILVKLQQPQLAPLIPASPASGPPPTRGGWSADATSAGRTAAGTIHWLLRIRKRTRLAYKTALEHVEELWLHASRAGCSEDQIIALLGTSKASGVFGTGFAIAKALQITKYDKEFEVEDSFRRGMEYLHLVHDRNLAAFPLWPGNALAGSPAPAGPATGACSASDSFRQVHLHVIEVPKQGVLADLHAYRKMLTTYIDSMGSFVAVRTVGTFINAMTRVDLSLDRAGLPYYPRYSGPFPAPPAPSSAEMQHRRGYLLFFSFMTRGVPGSPGAAESSIPTTPVVPGVSVDAPLYLRYGAFKEGSRLSRFFRTYARPELMATLTIARYSVEFKAAVAADARSNGLPVEHLLTSLIPGRPGIEDPRALLDMYNIGSDPRKTDNALRTSQALPKIRKWIDELVAVAVKNAHAKEVLRLWRMVAGVTPALGACVDVAACVKLVKMFLTPVPAPAGAAPAAALGTKLAELTQMIENSTAPDAEILTFVRTHFTLRASRDDEVDADVTVRKLKPSVSTRSAGGSTSHYATCDALLEDLVSASSAELATLPPGLGDAAVAVLDFARLRDERGGEAYSDFLERVVIPVFESPAAKSSPEATGDSQNGVSCGESLLAWLLQNPGGGRSVGRALIAGYPVETSEVVRLTRGGGAAPWLGGATTRRAMEVYRAIVDVEISDSVRAKTPYAAAYFERRATRYAFVRRHAPGGLKDLLELQGALGGRAAVEAVVETALKLANVRKRHEFWAFAVKCCLAPDVDERKLAEPREVSRRVSKSVRRVLREKLQEYRGERSGPGTSEAARLEEFIKNAVEEMPVAETPEEFDFDGFVDEDEEDERKFHEELKAKGGRRRGGAGGAGETMSSVEEEEQTPISVFESLYVWTFTLFAAVALKLAGGVDQP